MVACGDNLAEKWQEQYDLGQKYLLEEDYEAAIVAFTEAIEIDPNQPDAYIGRGNAYIFSGETEEHLTLALADYQQATDLDPTLVEAYLGIADVYIRQGDYDAALEILNKGLSETNGNDMIAAKIEEMESGNITDSHGNIRRRSNYDSSGNLVWYHELTYDEYGREASVTSYDGAGTQTAYLDIVYQEGLPSAGYAWESDTGILVKQFYTYDDMGNHIRMDEYRDDDFFSRYFIFQYDSNGNCIQSEQYGSSGQLQEVSKSEFDLEGHELKQEDYSVSLEQELILTDYHQWEYNSNGDIIRYSHYDADGQLYGYKTIEYDVEGNRIRTNTYDADEQLTSYYSWIYDEEGKEIGNEEYDADGNLIRKVIY